MKHPVGYAKPRRLATPKAKVRLDLKRRPQPEPENELGTEQKSSFWKWVGLVALLHVVVISLVYWIYETASTAKPPEQFISLLPEGDVVKGKPGAQEAHKLGPTTPAPAVHHAAAPPPPPVATAQPKPVVPPPTPIQPPKPTPVALDKPAPKPPPPKPAPPKIKVDLTVVDRPVPAADKPVTKPKPHLKKPAIKTTDDSQDTEAAPKPDSAGLSKEQIAAKLGDKLDAAGTKNAIKTGTSGATNTRANPFQDFYDMITQQINDEWEIPNVAAETTTNPLVHIYVEKDGHVPPESVYLVKSSGNSVYDDSAVAAAKHLGYLHEPLPVGCPPDISINFKPER